MFVPHLVVGDRYKYELVGPDDALQPLKADPYARAAQLRPDSASLVAALPPRRALPASRAGMNDRHAPMSIYEVHLGSWRRHVNGGFKTWDELAAELPAYVADLGFTHVELMPITEFPFDGSWGYQTLGLFAPTARFGPPEGFAPLRRRLPREGHRRAPRLGAGALPGRRARPGALRRHRAVRVRGSARGLPPRLEHATSTTSAGPRCATSWPAARCTGSSATASTACAWTRSRR